MSGIAGIIRFDGAPVDAGLVEGMTTAMAYRGPDGINHWRRGPVALGQCMLRTTPESLEETQPLTNEDASLVLVMDGRVDNWEELRRELLGRRAVLRDRSDAELVLRAYEVWGSACLPHIDGDFCLVIWDARQRMAFCARDRMGNKPFNYHWDGKTFVFSSELHAILALPWVKQELNQGMLAQYLAVEWYSRDETLWKGIRRLTEAHWLEVVRKGPQTREYWRPNVSSPLLYRTDGEYVEHYRELFFDTVQRLSRSQNKVAFEVSGGLDSSAIFAVAERLRRQHKLPAPGIEGYTLKFDDDSEANEIDYCRAVGTQIGTAIHEVEATIESLQWYRDWARTYREFPGYPNGVMGAGIRELAREHGCRTLLTGDGGDEWLGGSRDYYEEDMVSGRWRHLYDSMKTDCRELGAKRACWWLGRAGANLFLPRVVTEIMRKILAAPKGPFYDRQAWLGPRLSHLFKLRKSELGPLFADIELGRAGHRGQMAVLFDAYTILARESEDRIASRFGVELRKPYLNTAMVQFAFSTPERLRLRGGANKVLHRSAMAGLLPARVRERKTKADFMETFRKHKEEIWTAVSADMPKSGQEWVLADQLKNTYTEWGNPAHEGVPEWMLWSLFGCSALLPEAQDR